VNLIYVHKFLKVRCTEDSARLFSGIRVQKQWANIQIQEIVFKHKNFFTVKVTELVQAAGCGVSILEHI